MKVVFCNQWGDWMNICKRILSIHLAILLLIAMAGCAGEPNPPATTVPPTTEPTQPSMEFAVSSKSFAEKYGELYDKKRSRTTDYNGVTYHFDLDVSDEDKIAVVLESDALISLLMANLPEMEKELTVAVRDDDYPMRAVDHTLYIGIEHFKTQTYAIGMAWALFGHDVNYGLIYAHGTAAAAEMGYPTEEVVTGLAEALTLCDESPEYLDLSYPCFLPEYADEETLDQVKALATAFYGYLAENNQLSLLTDYSDEAYCQQLSAFLTANGEEAYSNADLQGTVFYYGGPLIRLVWETEDAVFYLEDAYAAQYQSVETGDLLNTGGYLPLRQMIVDYHLQADFMEQRLGQFGDIPEEKVDVLFQAGHATDRYSIANYNYSENLIRMFSAEPFLHEYGHYLLREAPIPSWLNELICYYYGYCPVDEHTTYMWAAESARMQSLDPNDSVEKYEYMFLDLLYRHLDHELDFADPDDFAYVYSGITMLTNSFSQLTNPDGGAEAKVSFLHYLIGLAGEEAAINAIATDDPETAFGKDWEPLMSDWEENIRADFAWLKQYYNI